MNKTGELFERFVEVIRRLRDPNGGCPWDLKQTHQSLIPYLIEESYEAIEAIEEHSDSQMTKELGDVLLQVVLHAQVAADRQAFKIDDVVSSVTEKMIRRHPHVFGDVKVSGSEQVLQNWEAIKLQERSQEEQPTADAKKPSHLDGVPKAMPALIRAQRLGEKAAHAHFDWRQAAGVWEKLREEFGEVEIEIETVRQEISVDGKPQIPTEAKERLKAEIGDLLFAACQLSRWLGISAEDALRSAADRFTDRFQIMEQQTSRPLAELTEDELEDLWQSAKRALAHK